MAYQKTVILAYRRFAGEFMAAAFVAKQQIIKSLDWGHMNSHLWNEILTSRAKIVTHCRFCISELHSHTNCPQKHQILVPNPMVNKIVGNLDRFRMRFAICSMTDGAIDVISIRASSPTFAQSARVDTHCLNAHRQGEVIPILPTDLSEGSNNDSMC